MEKCALTVVETAKLLNVSPSLINKWFSSGQLFGYKVPGTEDLFFAFENVQKFAEKHGLNFSNRVISKRFPIVIRNESMRLIYETAPDERTALINAVQRCISQSNPDHKLISDPDGPQGEYNLSLKILQPRICINPKGDEYCGEGYETESIWSIPQHEEDYVKSTDRCRV